MGEAERTSSLEIETHSDTRQNSEHIITGTCKYMVHASPRCKYVNVTRPTGGRLSMLLCGWTPRAKGVASRTVL